MNEYVSVYSWDMCSVRLHLVFLIERSSHTVKVVESINTSRRLVSCSQSYWWRSSRRTGSNFTLHSLFYSFESESFVWGRHMYSVVVCITNFITFCMYVYLVICYIIYVYIQDVCFNDLHEFLILYYVLFLFWYCDYFIVIKNNQ